MTATMHLAVADGVATVTLDRPDAHNAINEQFTRDLLDIVTECDIRDDVRCLLFEATGRMFTAGGDLSVFVGCTGPELSSLLRRMTNTYHEALERMVGMDTPVVATVQGSVGGGGLGIVLAADVAVAAPSATFGLGYGALGLTADGGTSWFLPRLAGLRIAQRMFLLNERLDAQAALHAGLVTEVADDTTTRARELAARLATGPTRAFGDMKRLLRDATSTQLVDHLEAESDSMSRLAATDDALEGIAAFTERRPPVFGRR